MKKSILQYITLLILYLIISVSARAQVYADPASGDTANFPYYVQMMQDPNANFNATVSAFEKYWTGRTNRSHTGWKVFKRWEYMHQNQAGPDGKLPAPGYVAAEYQNFLAHHPSSLPSGNWTEIGPKVLPTNTTNPYGQPNGMGRINGVGFHPTNPLIIYVCAPAGGLWKTTDGGSSWTSLTSYMPTLGTSSVLLDPVNPDWILIGTGDRDAGDAPGMGVYKSIDGGLTWQPSNAGMDNKIVGMMVMNPSNANIILAATSGGIYKSTDHGDTWALKTGNLTFKDIKFKPGDPAILYAAQNGKFFRSTDSGETWTQITSGIITGGRMVIGVSQNQPNTVYVCQTNGPFVGLMKSTNSGLTFTTQSTSPNIMSWECDGSTTDNQSWYDLCIAVDPNNANTLFVGGADMWKSVNGGVAWTINTHWKGASFGYPCAQSLHSDMHAMEWSPANGELYLGSDAGVFHTADLGTSWSDISSGLAIAQIYKIGQSATNGALTMNGLQDNGTEKCTGEAFTTVFGGDGMQCAIDYSDTNFRYGEYCYGTMYRSNGGPYTFIAYNGYYINEDGGWVTPFFLHATNPNIMFAGYKNIWRSTNVKAAVTWTKITSGETSTCGLLIQSPVNTNILYMTHGNVLKRSDNGNAASPTWTVCNNAINGQISAIAAHPADSNTLVAAYANKIFRSADKGNTWADITGTLPDIFISTIVYDKNANEGIYIGNTTGVFYKDATMNDWIVYNTNLPTAHVTDLGIFYDSVNPVNNRLKAATFGRGLWESPLYPVIAVNPANRNVTAVAGVTDFTVTSNSTWTASSDAAWCTVTPSGSGNGSIIADYIGNASVTPRVATITVTIPGLNPFPVTVTQAQMGVSVHENQGGDIRIYPNPTSGIFTISAPGFDKALLEVSVSDISGKLFKYSRFKGETEYRIDLSGFQKGCYFIKIKTADEVVIRKLILEH